MRYFLHELKQQLIVHCGILHSECRTKIEGERTRPRVLFSAPSRKTFAAWKSAERRAMSRAQHGWTRGASRDVQGHPGAGVLPNFAFRDYSS